jgi:hypothetical protein
MRKQFLPQQPKLDCDHLRKHPNLLNPSMYGILARSDNATEVPEFFFIFLKKFFSTFQKKKKKKKKNRRPLKNIALFFCGPIRRV